MRIQSTLCLIKPLAIQKKFAGAIIHKIEESGFTVTAIKMLRLTKTEAKDFYNVHHGKDFFEGLSDYMSSSHIIAMVLCKENAVTDFRKIIGATNPADAEPDTIRNLFGTSLQKNAVHGSDSPENAVREIGFFFKSDEIYLPE